MKCPISLVSWSKCRSRNGGNIAFEARSGLPRWMLIALQPSPPHTGAHALKISAIFKKRIIAKANELSSGDIAPKSDVKLRIPTVIEDILEAVHDSNS